MMTFEHWCIMRAAAIERHRFLNIYFEASNPFTWSLHMAVVRGFYGF